MTIKRINEFPENSGSISSDDVFLFMDDPNGEGVTKKISLTDLSNALSTGNNITDTGDITFHVNTISTINENEDIIFNPSGIGNIIFEENTSLKFNNTTSLSKGTFDNSTGGGSGISLTCAVGYELNWQGGHLRSTADYGISSSNILIDSAIQFPGTGISFMTVDNSAITYPDGTTQSTAPSVTNLVAGTGIGIENVSGIYTISSSGEASVIKTTVFNETGSSIPKFSVIYINGGHGDMPTINLAVASGEATSNKTYGVTATNIDNMQIGSVVVLGSLNGLNTDQFNPTAPAGNVNGVSLWLSPTTPGGVTTTKPSAPNHAVYVGTIVRTHQNEGIVEVRIQNGYELEELHNVKINNLQHNDILVYNSGNNLWENKNNIIISNTSGISGASQISNIVKISQIDYDNLAIIDSNTLYFIV